MMKISGDLQHRIQSSLFASSTLGQVRAAQGIGLEYIVYVQKGPCFEPSSTHDRQNRRGVRIRVHPSSISHSGRPLHVKEAERPSDSIFLALRHRIPSAFRFQSHILIRKAFAILNRCRSIPFVLAPQPTAGPDGNTKQQTLGECRKLCS
jgi:hypothetical protein